MDETRKPARKPRATTAKTAAKAAPARNAARPATRSPGVTAKAKVAGPARAVPTAQDREHMVRTAAYFRAERRGFAPGNEWDDWLAAEAEVGSLPVQNGTPRPRKTPARKKAAG